MHVGEHMSHIMESICHQYKSQSSACPKLNPVMTPKDNCTTSNVNTILQSMVTICAVNNSPQPIKLSTGFLKSTKINV